MPLTDTFIKQVKPSGKPAGDKYADGAGMFLLVKAAGKYWRMDYAIHGKRKTLALGVYPEVSLAKARQRREDAKKLLADGLDPSQAKREEKLHRAAAASNTFEAIARLWLTATAASRAESTQGKVQTWLEKDVFPSIGASPITSIGPRDVLAVVRKIEARKAFDTAHRVNQICGQVFRFAVAEGSAERDVTTDLRGALQRAEKTHYAAVTDPSQLGPLLRAIHAYTGYPVASAALKLTPLVFVRPGELRSAEWTEFDLEAAEWRIPGAKMKMKNDHLVPLSRQAVAILQELQPITGHGRYVFPSMRTGERCMSENTVNAALRGMGYSNEVQTAHGFRATARTIMDEVLGERVDLIEHQLAHAVKDPNGRAYNRTAHLPARREMMQRWADYLDKLRQGADVIQLRANG
ncbi:integrase arm-type DNA-binding domain-containing protein [Curvibacter sp. HBC61]|uniref:Integrase arm-type DNA-binding domain-containing protein n=1 Tax=Curvibacter cyanobacteriorum TaxID=3026422 RepID=A0ABT5MXG9_9BURK|nr:integrase arm-type DNA-binding domain-containing protein [Curvibacter sp. HBC61]MDD0838740.1 integrase arm-type DNA-binding domain-containing protein [Curvibacter sp. HBC61]